MKARTNAFMPAVSMELCAAAFLCTMQRILASRQDLDTVVLPILIQRFPQWSEEQTMVIASIPREEIRHTRAVQDWLSEGRQAALQEGRRK